MVAEPHAKPPALRRYLPPVARLVCPGCERRRKILVVARCRCASAVCLACGYEGPVCDG
jgi:hypothetical protein